MAKLANISQYVDIYEYVYNIIICVDILGHCAGCRRINGTSRLVRQEPERCREYASS